MLCFSPELQALLMNQLTVKVRKRASQMILMFSGVAENVFYVSIIGTEEARSVN